MAPRRPLPQALSLALLALVCCTSLTPVLLVGADASHVSDDDAMAFVQSFVKSASDTEVDLDSCRTDAVRAFGDAKDAFHELDAAFKAQSARDLESGMDSLSDGLASVQDSLEACGVNGVAKLLGAVLPTFEKDLAVTEKIIAAGVDVTDEVRDAVSAGVDGNWAKAGAELTAALITVFAREDGPLESFLKELLFVFRDMKDFHVSECKTDATRAWTSLSAAVTDLRDGARAASKNAVAAALGDMDAALDALQSGLRDCGVNGMSKVITDTLKNADNEIEDRLMSANKLYIRGAEVFKVIVAAADDLDDGDYVAFAEDLLKLLGTVSNSNKFRALMAKVVQVIEFTRHVDLQQCTMDFGAAASDFDAALAAIRARGEAAHDLDTKLALLSRSMRKVGEGFEDCGFNRASELIQDVFKIIGHNRSPVDTDQEKNIFIRGVDVTSHLVHASEAWANEDFIVAGVEVGRAILDAGLSGKFADWIAAAIRSSGHFRKFDFESCKRDIGDIASDFHSHFMAISAPAEEASEDERADALRGFIAEMALLDDGLSKCGVDGGLELLSAWKKDGKVSTAAKIFLRGTDVTSKIVLASHQWRDGRYAISAVTVGKAVFSAYPELVRSAVGMFFKGMMQGLSGGFKFDIEMCKDDMAQSWASLTDACGLWKQDDRKGSILALADALATLSDSLVDCGVRDAAKVIAVASEEVGGGKVVVQALKVVVHGIDVAREVGDMWEAYEDKDYVSLGVHTAELINSVLLRRRAVQDFQVGEHALPPQVSEHLLLTQRR